VGKTSQHLPKWSPTSKTRAPTHTSYVTWTRNMDVGYG